jgi:hypothetical protein
MVACLLVLSASSSTWGSSSRRRSI